MLNKSTWLHLRIPFSFFLLPVFIFSLSQNDNYSWLDAILIFIILHFLIYPASNGYNSYFDKDEESIGGLKNPPPVSKELYFASLVFDLFGLLLGFFLNIPFVLMIFIYGLISKAYSHPSIRLKKYPFWSWLAAGIFQGYFTFMAIEVGLSSFEAFTNMRFHQAGVLSSALLLGSYPMTQVYQHREDSKRGDKTLSLLLGVRGTFIFTAIVFVIAMGGYTLFFTQYYNLTTAVSFHLFLLPVLVYFLIWFARIWKDEREANFASTMKLNFISALCMNFYFALLIPIESGFAISF